MKNKLTNISRISLFPSLTAIAVVCIALPVRAALPYPTASTISQLIADINDANTNGGTFTINLQPNSGVTNLAGIGGIIADVGSASGTTTVNLTIIGNGITFNAGGSLLTFFSVFPGSSLTLEQMSLQNAYADGTVGGALGNLGGTLTISNCTLSGNTCANPSYAGSPQQGAGGAIFNYGTLIIENSILSSNSITGADDNAMGGAIYNDGGTVTISHSILTNNYADVGGGIYNYYGTVTVENSSRISGNDPDDVDNWFGTLYLDSSSEIGIVDDTPAKIVQGSGPSPYPRISLTSSNTIVVSWPYPSNGWSLQQNSDLTTANWVTSTNTVANDGTNNFIIAPPSLDRLFFRLKF